jgi:hypothetical protein
MFASTETLSRRAALGALASLPALAIAPAAVLASTDPISPLQGLGIELERLWKIESAMFAREDLSDAEVSQCTEATSGVVNRILAVPAKTIGDFKVKARALAWCYGGDEIDLDAPANATTDIKLARSIIHDLLAMEASNG